MRNKSLILSIAAVSAFAVGCGGAATTPNSNTAANTNTAPAGISNSPLPPSTNTTPGIPGQPSNVPKGTTPTPGIPDPATIGKTPVPKGATPTPGIPSPEELRRQMKNPKDVNAPSDPNAPMSQRDGTNSPRNKRKQTTPEK